MKAYSECIVNVPFAIIEFKNEILRNDFARRLITTRLSRTKFWFSEFGQMAKRLRSVHGHIISSAIKRQNERLIQPKLYNIK